VRLDEVLDPLGAHAAGVVVAVAVDDLTPQLLGFDELLGLEGLERVECLRRSSSSTEARSWRSLISRSTSRRRALISWASEPCLLHLLQLGFELEQAGFLPLFELLTDQLEL
jgi:hypothetical protein